MDPLERNISDLFSHLFFRTSKKRELFLQDKEMLQNFLKEFAPHKLSIQTLQEVFGAFSAQWKKAGDVSAVYFDYGLRRWKATVKTEESIYGGKKVQFCNIKLPNDGFFYTEEYSAGTHEEFAETEECLSFVESVIHEVVPADFKIGNLQVKYFEPVQRLAIYIWNEDGSKCCTVKFENGYHLGASNQDVGTYRKLLAKLTQKQ